MKKLCFALLGLMTASVFAQIEVTSPNGHVGIGTSDPQDLLHVDGNTRTKYLRMVEGSIQLSIPDDPGWARGLIYYDTGSFAPPHVGGFGLYGSGTTLNRMFMTFGNNPYSSTLGIQILPDGNVGIGTISPNRTLEVAGDLAIGSTSQAFQSLLFRPVTALTGYNGTLQIESNTTPGSGTTKFLTYFKTTSSGTGGQTIHDVSIDGNLGIGTFATSNKLQVDSDLQSDIASFRNTHGAIVLGHTSGLASVDLGASQAFRIRQQSNVPFYLDTNGNVGIGTTSPDTRLELKSDITGSDATILKLDNSGTNGNVTGLEFFTSTTNHSGSYRTGRIAAAFDGTSYVDSRLSFYSMGVGNTLIETMTLKHGDVGIGTTDTFGYKLAVDGVIGSDEVVVHDTTNFPDYVFEKDYELLTIKQVEEHIQEKGHLPNVPSAKEIEENGGFSVGKMNKKLLEKIEELTLYLIDQNKKLEKQEERIQALEKELRKSKNK